MKIVYDLERNGNYYIYTENDFYSCRIIKWFIPKELHNNEIVKSQMSMKLFDDLFKHINSIKAYNVQLANLYLDIEKQSIEKRKQVYKEKCYKIIDSINKGLPPYHWEVEETNEDIRGMRTPCYLIGLFTGEDTMMDKIEKM